MILATWCVSILIYRLTNQAKWIPLSSSHKKAKVSGEVQVKAGLVDPANPNATKEELQAAWDRFIGSLEQETTEGIQAVIDHPATESVGIGMFRANTDDSYIAEFSAEDLDDEMHPGEAEEATGKKKLHGRIRALRRRIREPFEFHQGSHDVMGVVFMDLQSARDLPPEKNGTYSSL